MNGDALPSESSDMFSFGIIMSEMLTGEPTPQRARKAVESKVSNSSLKTPALLQRAEPRFHVCNCSAHPLSSLKACLYDDSA